MEPVNFPLLAEHIRTAHARALEAARTSLQHAKWAGELLLKAKGAIPFGLFEEWVVQNCGFTPRTARTYLRIARSVHLHPAPPDETSCRAALRALSNPSQPRRPRRPRPTPGDVAERMQDFGLSGELANVMGFLRSFGIRLRKADPPPERPPAGQNESALPKWLGGTNQNESALPFSPPAAPAPARPALTLWQIPVGIGSALPICPPVEPEEPARASGMTAYVPQPGDVVGWIGLPNDSLWEERFARARAARPRDDSG